MGKRDYVSLYNCGLVFGWHVINKYLLSRGFCKHCIAMNTRVVFRVLKMRDMLCEIVAHVILCKRCFGEFFCDVMRRIIEDYDVEFNGDVEDEEHFDKVFDFNINNIVTKRDCYDVRKFAQSGAYALFPHVHGADVHDWIE